MVHISLYYNDVHGLSGFDINDGSIDDLSSSLEDFKQGVAALDHRVQQFRLARDHVIDTNDTECDVSVTSFSEDGTTRTLVARIAHDSQIFVQQGMQLYIFQAGMPDIIGNGSDYELAREVLARYNKDLKIRFWDKEIGAHVVDKKLSTFNRRVIPILHHLLGR